MRPVDIGDLVEASDPRVSPDGATVAFVVTRVDVEANEYKSAVWVAATDGSFPPCPFTEAAPRETRPRWSPDGLLVAYVAQPDPKLWQLCVAAIDGGEHQMLLEWPEAIEDVAWSPSGGQIAFTARSRDESQYSPESDRDRPPRRISRLAYRLDSVGWTVDRPRHVFVVDLEPASDELADDAGEPGPRQVTFGDVDDGGCAWSPDGDYLAFTSARTESWDTDLVNDVFVVRADGEGEPRRLTDSTASLSKVSWSPSGEQVAYVWADRHSMMRNGQVGVVDLATGAQRLVTCDLDLHCAPYLGDAREPVWDGEWLLFQADESGNVPIYRSDRNETNELVLGGNRQVTGFDKAGGTLAFTATAPVDLAELFVFVRGEERQLTNLGASFSDEHPVSAPNRFTATSPDGAEVEAWIMLPDGYVEGDRYPLVLDIHGGPFSQYGHRFFDEFQLLAGAGFAVLYCNPRGSSGYGERFAREIRGPKAAEDPGSGWGGVDYDDLMAVLDEALRRFDFVDSDRLAVMGGSYGGYMTSWIVGHTDRFRAAISERACNNLLTFAHTADIGAHFPAGYIGASHLDDPEEFIRQSPVTYASNISTPLLILHSENDLRCPVEQAEDLFVRLRLLGREVEFVRFPGESHELSRSGAPAHRVTRMEIILEFLSRHLA